MIAFNAPMKNLAGDMAPVEPSFIGETFTAELKDLEYKFKILRHGKELTGA